MQKENIAVDGNTLFKLNLEGTIYIVARDEEQAKRHLKNVLKEEALGDCGVNCKVAPVKLGEAIKWGRDCIPYGQEIGVSSWWSIEDMIRHVKNLKKRNRGKK